MTICISDLWFSLYRVCVIVLLEIKFIVKKLACEILRLVVSKILNLLAFEKSSTCLIKKGFEFVKIDLLTLFFVGIETAFRG